MNVLADRHHADLLYSLQRLFEDRLNYRLYVPVGRDWWDADYWKFGQAYGDDRLAKQFLNTAAFREIEPGIFLTFDSCHPERPIYGITLSRARSMRWDCVIATVQENQLGFRIFANEIGAKYLYHIGNARQAVNWQLDPLALDSTMIPLGGRGLHISQEFDSDSIFRYRSPRYTQRVTSFLNLLPLIPECWEPFCRLRALMPKFMFRSYGHDCPDGFLTPVAAIAEEMTLADWAYHDKPTGDGFGHVLHCWAAIGRPLIGHASYYQGQRASIFWSDGISCIDLDKHSVEEAAKMITEMPEDHYERMCLTIRDIFEATYDPANDSELLARFLLKEKVAV